MRASHVRRKREPGKMMVRVEDALRAFASTRNSSISSLVDKKKAMLRRARDGDRDALSAS